MSGFPIVYQDVMRVIVAGELTKPHIGIGRSNSTESPLILTVAEARELAAALTWALSEYDARMGRESFYPGAPRRLRRQ